MNGSEGPLQISTATRDDVAMMLQWAAAEGWNPGRRDLDAFLAPDPEGFLIGRLDGEPVASISFVRYSPAFAFLGFYIVTPEHRGHGHGIEIWRAAMARAEGRTVGLDGVPAQQANYARSGFVLARQNVRYVGPIERSIGDGTAPDPDLVQLSAVDPSALERYDQAIFPAPRPAFLEAWPEGPGRQGFALVRAGEIAGYGVIRPSVDGRRIGPLFADDAAMAERLLLALAAVGSGPVAIDVPMPNAAAVRLAEGLGLQPSFETARMYAGTPPAEPLDRIFGVTSLELG